MALSRFRWLFVIARNSSFTYKGRAVDVKQVGRELGVRYVLEGSVRKAGNRIRIAGQLIDAETGAHLWADRFDGALEDIFDLQDHVTSSVVGAIAPRLQREEIKRARRKPTENLDAYDYYLRGLAKCSSVDQGCEQRGARSSFARRSSSTRVWPAPMAWPRGATCGESAWLDDRAGAGECRSYAAGSESGASGGGRPSSAVYGWICTRLCSP